MPPAPIPSDVVIGLAVLTERVDHVIARQDEAFNRLEKAFKQLDTIEKGVQQAHGAKKAVMAISTVFGGITGLIGAMIAQLPFFRVPH